MVRNARKRAVLCYSIIIGILISMPFLAPGMTQYGISLLMYIALSTGWNIQGGYLGDLSFGHVSFFGISAYTVAILECYDLLHLAFINILLGALLAAAFAIIIGIPFLRLRGFYFAIGTLGLSNLLFLLYKNVLSPITKGAMGLTVPPPKPYYIETFYYSILFIAIVCAIVSYIMIKSRVGLAFRAIRDEPTAARALGINITYYRVLGFAVSALITGIVGGFYAYQNNYVNPEGAFSVAVSFEMLIMVTLGGAGTLSGPIIGAVILYIMEEIGRVYIQQGYYILPAFMLIIVFIFMPNGIVGMINEKDLFSKLPDFLKR